MKKTIYFILIACASLLTVQCARLHESELTQKEKASGSYMELRGSSVFMSISVADGDTRTTIGTDRTVSWNTGDTLYVVAPTGGCLGYLVAEAAGSSVNFIGTIGTWSGTQNLQFYYLGSGRLAGGATTFPYDITNQAGTLESLASNLQLMHGQITGLAAGTKTLGALSMTSIIAVARFDLLTNSGFSTSYTVKCKAPATATLNLADGTFTGLTNNTITLFNPSNDYYAALIPGSQNFTFSQINAPDVIFNATTAIAANEFITSAGSAIVVMNGGIPGYTEDGWGYGPGIEINGVVWAPVNCGSGYNSAYPYGKMYQFGRVKGCGYDDGSTYRETVIQTAKTGQTANPDDNTFYSGSTISDWYNGGTSIPSWPLASTDQGYLEDKIANPCPTGWRLPTDVELKSLIDNSTSSISTSDWGTPTGKTLVGRTFYGNTSKTGNGLYLPASGFRSKSSGVSASRTSFGWYWSNSGNTLFFNDQEAFFIPGARADGDYVRCVKDTQLPHYEVNGVDYGAGTKIGDVIWAPVNCGTDATHTYGLIYEWGRKDGTGYTGETGIQTMVNSTVAAENEDPNSYYKGTSDWLATKDDTRWNSAAEPNDASKQTIITPTKTSFDPCPKGWRVPTYYELESLQGGKTSTLSQTGTGFYAGISGKYFNGTSTASSGVFLPFIGYRGYSITEFVKRGTHGSYWSSTVSNTSDGYAYYLHNSTEEGVSMVKMSRAFGNAVRCVYDAN